MLLLLLAAGCLMLLLLVGAALLLSKQADDNGKCQSCGQANDDVDVKCQMLDVNAAGARNEKKNK